MWAFGSRKRRSRGAPRNFYFLSNCCVVTLCRLQSARGLYYALNGGGGSGRKENNLKIKDVVHEETHIYLFGVSRLFDSDIHSADVYLQGRTILFLFFRYKLSFLFHFFDEINLNILIRGNKKIFNFLKNVGDDPL